MCRQTHSAPGRVPAVEYRRCDEAVRQEPRLGGRVMEAGSRFQPRRIVGGDGHYSSAELFAVAWIFPRWG
jgi:hypothetical protein